MFLGASVQVSLRGWVLGHFTTPRGRRRRQVRAESADPLWNVTPASSALVPVTCHRRSPDGHRALARHQRGLGRFSVAATFDHTCAGSGLFGLGHPELPPPPRRSGGRGSRWHLHRRERGRTAPRDDRTAQGLAGVGRRDSARRRGRPLVGDAQPLPDDFADHVRRLQVHQRHGACDRRRQHPLLVHRTHLSCRRVVSAVGRGRRWQRRLASSGVGRRENDGKPAAGRVDNRQLSGRHRDLRRTVRRRHSRRRRGRRALPRQ